MGKGSKRPAKKNNFMIFVDEFTRNQSKRGVRYASQREAVEAASPEWEAMPQHRKDEYRQLSKEADRERYTSQGVSYTQVEQEEKEKERQIEQELFTIEAIIGDAARYEQISDATFCIIHTNYYCITINDDYVTCEIALAKFNLKNGIQRTYHCFPHTTIPTGYLHNASVRSKEIGIGLPPIPDATDDYPKIYNTVVKMLEDCQTVNGVKGLPPLFAMPEDIQPAANFIERLCEASNNNNEFTIYSLPLLFYKLQAKIANNANVAGLATFALAQDELERDGFNFCDTLSCSWHQNLDQYPKCSLSFVKRMAYGICDYCCPITGDTMKPGLHIPHGIKINPIVKIGHNILPSAQISIKAESSKQTLPQTSTKLPNPSNLRKPFDYYDDDNDDEKTNSANLIPTSQESKEPWVTVTSGRSMQVQDTTNASDSNFPALSSRGRGRGWSSVAGGSSRMPSESEFPPMSGRGRGRGNRR